MFNIGDKVVYPITENQVTEGRGSGRLVTTVNEGKEILKSS